MLCSTSNLLWNLWCAVDTFYVPFLRMWEIPGKGGGLFCGGRAIEGSKCRDLRKDLEKQHELIMGEGKMFSSWFVALQRERSRMKIVRSSTSLFRAIYSRINRRDGDGAVSRGENGEGALRFHGISGAGTVTSTCTEMSWIIFYSNGVLFSTDFCHTY